MPRIIAKGPHYPIEKEPKISTLDRPLIVESAFPGWLPLSVNPHIPIRPEEVAQEVVESIRAGAGAIHIHPRDPDDGERYLIDTNALKEIQDMVFEECPDIFTWNHTWVGKPNEPIDYVEHTKELIGYGNGPRHCEGSVVLITLNPNERNTIRSGDAQAVKEGVPWLEAHGVKPIFQIRDTHGIEWLRTELIEPGLAKWKPFVCCLHMGKHHSHALTPDPWGHLQLFSSMNMVRSSIPDSIIGLRAGGRNWLPITVAAISMGIDMVGVGMEDCLWMYPHKDEIITKNSEVIRKIVAIARELGREVAGGPQIREILNSKQVNAIEAFGE